MVVSVFRLVLKRVWRDIQDSRNGGHCLLTVGGWFRWVKIVAKCVIYIWLNCLAWPTRWVFPISAVTEIKELSCCLWWMHEWRNLLTSTNVGYRVCHVGSCESLKFRVQGVSPTDLRELTVREIMGFDCTMNELIATMIIRHVFCCLKDSKLRTDGGIWFLFVGLLWLRSYKT